MKWYLVVRCDNTVDNPFIADIEDLKEFDEWDFYRGQTIQKWNTDIFFQAKDKESEGVPDDVLQNALGLPIYSNRLQSVLNNAGISGIQYLPVRVLNVNGSLVDGFSIANCLNLIPCLDFEQSEYRIREDRPGEVRSISKMVLKKDAIDGYDILRMKEFKLNLIVSERFKEVFESGKYTGYSFHERKLL